MIARAGIVAGALAFWLTLPPLATSVVAVPVALGVLAIACGSWAIARAETRRGSYAIAAGVLGATLGVLAVHAGRGNLDAAVVWSALIASMLINATPLTYAAIGGLFSERSGVVNIGLEGMMLIGAFFGIWGSDVTGSWALGLAIAIAFGGLVALVYAFFAIHLRTDQIIGGTAVNFLALGVTGYLFVDIYGTVGTPPLRAAQQIPDLTLSRSSGFFAQAFGQLNLMVWLSFAVVALTYVVVFKTPLGLRIRSVGEHPRAADAVGISVYKTRYAAVVLSGMLSAMGGAYLSIGFVHSFSRAHLRALAPRRGVRRSASLRLLERARAAPGHDPELELVCRALPGAPIRPHIGRGRRRDRPLDSPRRGWTALREAVITAPRSRWCSGSPRCSSCRLPSPSRGGALASACSTPLSRFRWRSPAAWRRSSSCAARAGGSAGRSSGQAGRAGFASGGFSPSPASRSPSRPRSPSASTNCCSASRARGLDLKASRRYRPRMRPLQGS